MLASRPTLVFPRVAIGISLGNIALDPILLSLSPTPQKTLQMPRFAAPLQGLLVAMELDI